MTSTEQWRPIPGHPTYQVSNLGRVMSFRRPSKPLVMKPAIDRTSGYGKVSLYGTDKPVLRSVHSLVAETFLGPRPDGMDIRHLDGNPQNNALMNLAYGTREENMADAVRHGVHVWAAKTHCPQGHPYDDANTYRTSTEPRHRKCLTCKRANGLARYHRLAAAARKTATTVGLAVVLVAASTGVASADGGCHPHPEVCEAEALDGTDHFPADQPETGVCTLGPLSWMCAINLGRTVR